MEYLFKYIGTYGLTTMKMDDGMKIQLPKQILQTQKHHIIMQYKKCCNGMCKLIWLWDKIIL